MSRTKVLLWFSIAALTFGAPELPAAATTYVVGTCKPAVPSFSHISDALAALPPPTVVQLCPGTYYEQVVITQAVTLQGITIGDSDQAVIAPPAAGLKTNATDDLGDPLAVQVYVNNASGPVNISNVTVDGTGNSVSGNTFIVGIFYQNSPGTVNRITMQNQSGDGFGIGIWLEGGAANPSVTVENSSIHDFDDKGLYAQTNSGSSELTATIKGNNVNQPFGNAEIDIGAGTTASVTGNLVVGSNKGIASDLGASGSISGNTIVNAFYGVYASADGVSVTSNKILGTGIVFGGATTGISLFTTVAAIQGNSITQAGIGIEFNCTANSMVKSNTINDAAAVGVDRVPATVPTTNTYFNVATIRTGGC